MAPKTLRRRALSSGELRPESSVGDPSKQTDFASRLLPVFEDLEIIESIGCKDRPHICGKEAACRSFKNNTSKCVCPHDSSTPTNDLKCPNRLTVPLTPRPIHNIIPPSSNITNSTTTLPEQVEQSHQNVPEIVGIVIIFFMVLSTLVGIVYWCRRRDCNTKCRRNSLNPSPMNLKKGLLLANKYTPNPQYFSCASPEVPMLRRDCFVFLHDIGEGCFGKVYKGK